MSFLVRVMVEPAALSSTALTISAVTVNVRVLGGGVGGAELSDANSAAARSRFPVTATFPTMRGRSDNLG